MTKGIIFITTILLFFSAGLYAQTSFSVQYDTVFSSPPIDISTILEDRISTTSGIVTITWKVIASDFPPDWVTSFCICDNSSCYPITTLWAPTGGTLAAETSHPYANTSDGNFDMLIDFTGTSSAGCHYLTIRMDNKAIPSDIAYETYLICNNAKAGVSGITKSSDDIVVYPNPAHDEVNVIYDPHFNIRDIIIYNTIGKVLAAYKTSKNNGANFDLWNISPGFYFLQLINSDGEVVVTKKFTKQ